MKKLTVLIAFAIILTCSAVTSVCAAENQAQYNNCCEEPSPRNGMDDDVAY